MQQTETKVNNILYAKRAWLCDSNLNENEGRRNGQDALLKYFPKYIHDIELRGYDRRANTKLKRVKILHRLFADWQGNMPMKKAKVILANKIKSVQIYDGLESPKDKLKGIKLFPSLIAISMRQTSVGPEGWGYNTKDQSVMKKEVKDLYRLVHYMKAMHKLESVDIQFDHEAFARVLRGLDSLRRLKDLKHLKINLEVFHFHNKKLLGDYLLTFKNLFHYVTLIKFAFFGPDGFETFKEFREKCVNLRQMHLAIQNREYLQNDQFQVVAGPYYKVTSNYLQGIEAFQRLEAISVYVEDCLTFIRDFTLPTSIKHVQLIFQMSSSEEINKDFREDPMFIRFFERWSKLINLESIDFRNTHKMDKELGHEVAQEILKRVPQLKKLCFHPGKISVAKIFDFVGFFKPLEAVNKSLEILDIDTLDQLLLKGELHFPKLLRLELRGDKLFRNLNLENYIKLLENSPGRRIEFRDYSMISAEIFLKFLEGLKSLEEGGQKLELVFHPGIRCRLSENEWNQLVEGLEEFEKNAKDMRNISIYLTMGMDSERNMMKQRFPNFGNGKLFKKFIIN